MSKYFTRTFRVDWAEINALGQVHLSGYFRYVMETAWDWGAAVGLGIADSEKLGLGWVVREMQISLHRPLCPEDVFELTIWLAEWRRVRGTRYFELRLKERGELIAQGTQEIVSLDLRTLRPVPIPDQAIDKVTMENPRTVPHRRFPKVKRQPAAAFAAQRTVHWQDLDAQEHVNHANYAAFAEDAVVTALAEIGWPPARFKAENLAIRNRNVHIQYLSPAAWGEKLDVHTFLAEVSRSGSEWYIEIKRHADGAAIARCLVEWEVRLRDGGAPQPLPDSLFMPLKQSAAALRGDG
jgi:acyl-CoA thioester hydrolase